ncbi:type VII secretion integral membrane protein EccD [Saccharopolyspora indica]|uniref:type VII secretion integral membrane protein EccD n=1 Tax=Saccharopolyspora indica TaxID=1229659 RepID=UPI0022EA4496|nr:type VII secretion integral membrane protein EccD [Saccharopolyspora indica]MDA3647485.1 type VII secretion integral membrane protein EccD [Saccharopolyspora indica]
MDHATTTAPVRLPGAAHNEFGRIGIAGSSSRVDLAVPFGVPLAALRTSLLRHTGEKIAADGGVGHGGWVLRRADGTGLDPALSLRDNEIAEGDLLFFTHGREERTPLYDDVVEVIGDEGVRSAWSSKDTRRVTAATAAVGIAGAVAAVMAVPGILPGILALVVAALICVAGTLLSRAFGDVPGGCFAIVLGAGVAAAGAVKLLGPGTSAGHLLLGVAVIAAVAAAGPALIGGGDSVFAALIVAGALGAVAALISLLWGVDAARSAAVVAPLAVALTSFLPPLALNLARVPAPQVTSRTEELAKISGHPGFESARVRVRRARQLLAGMLVGTHLTATTGVLVLVWTGEVWSFVLGGVLIALFALRVRLFREAEAAYVPWIAGLVAAAGTALAAACRTGGEVIPLLAIAAPIGLVIAIAACAVGLLAGRRVSPRLTRTLDVVEVVLLLSVIPLVLAVWDVYVTLLNLKA